MFKHLNIENTIFRNYWTFWPYFYVRAIPGGAIQEYVERKGLTVVPAFTGHGIGSYFHGPPDIFSCRNSYPGTMSPGMTFTVEPIGTGPFISFLTYEGYLEFIRPMEELIEWSITGGVQWESESQIVHLWLCGRVKVTDRSSK